MAKIAFTVHGVAQTAGSKRAFPFAKKSGGLGVRVTDDNAKSRDWKTLVALEAGRAYSGPLLDGALRLTLVFHRPRPKGHFGKRGLLASAAAYPTTKPDVLKLARAVEDALTGVIWRDDAQICQEILEKRYGESAMVDVLIELVDRARMGVPEMPFDDLLKLSYGREFRNRMD